MLKELDAAKRQITVSQDAYYRLSYNLVQSDFAVLTNITNEIAHTLKRAFKKKRNNYTTFLKNPEEARVVGWCRIFVNDFPLQEGYALCSVSFFGRDGYEGSKCEVRYCVDSQRMRC